MSAEQKSGFGATSWAAQPAPQQQQAQQVVTSPAISLHAAVSSVAEQQAQQQAQQALLAQQAAVDAAEYQQLQTYTSQAVAGLHGAQLGKATADGQALFRGLKVGCVALLICGVAAMAIRAW